MTEPIFTGVAIAIIAFVFILLAGLVLKPIKLLWKLLINSGLGLLLLLIFNYGAGYLSIALALPVNIPTILIAGFLGVPGIILLICFQFLVR
jgi:inhibitor of the pro-sigma K processing machinery